MSEAIHKLFKHSTSVTADRVKIFVKLRHRKLIFPASNQTIVCLKMGNKVGKSSGNSDRSSKEENLSQELIEASQKGQVKRIRELVEKGADLNTTAGKGHTPLITAMYCKQLQSVRALIKAGADVNQRCDVGPRSDTPLSLAAGINDAKCLDLLLKSGADVNVRDVYQRTALMDLMNYDGRHECMDLLINAGADVNEALIYAAELGQRDNVEKLLQAGAEIDHLSPHGITALTRVVQRLAFFTHPGGERLELSKYTECALFLIEAGADVNACGTTGVTAMAYVVDTGVEELLRTLINAGIDPCFISKKYDDDGDTVLMKAAIKGNDRFVELLIDAGADVNSVNNSGSTALMFAAENSHHSCVNALIKAGADVNMVDNEGNTALIKSTSRYNTKPVLLLLLQAGAKINIFNKSNQNALKHHMVECQSVNRETIKLLVTAGETLERATSTVTNTRNQLLNLIDYLEQEDTLKAACREAIRKHLLEIDPREHLFYRVPKIGLPAALTKFMLFGLSLDE